MLRGIFAIMLGLVLIFNPEKTRIMLANFMGIFWLTTGILLLDHTSSALGDQTDRALGRKTSIVLGAMLIISPLEQGPIVYWAATIWALVGGSLLINDAFYQRARLKREKKAEENPPTISYV